MGGIFSSDAGSKYEASDSTDGPVVRPMSIDEEEVVPEVLTPQGVGLDDIPLDEWKDSKEIAEYCLPLMVLHFCGQTSGITQCESTDAGKGKKELNLRVYLKMMDRFIRQFDDVTKFTGEEEEYKLLIRLVALQRHRKGDETVDQCYNRLMKDSKRFVNIYHERGALSEPLHHKTYWASRQQLLAGKVIADWVDKANGSLDPIFGVMLQPTAGRVGPGDTGWFHDALFDDRGHMAYHSAVHDSFGYLINFHKTGPGYDYLKGSTWFSTENCLAGQIPGIHFWKDVIDKVTELNKTLHHWRY